MKIRARIYCDTCEGYMDSTVETSNPSDNVFNEEFKCDACETLVAHLISVEL